MIAIKWIQAHIRFIAAALILLVALVPLRDVVHSKATVATQAAVATNAHLAATDTQIIRRAIVAADSAQSNEAAAKHQAATARDRATRAANHADTLREAVAVAPTLADSATTLEAAFDATSDEALALSAAEAPTDQALAWADVQADSLRSAVHVSEVRANRADSITQLLSTALARADRCRLLHFIPCPSRRLLAGALVAAVLVGRAR